MMYWDSDIGLVWKGIERLVASTKPKPGHCIVLRSLRGKQKSESVLYRAGKEARTLSFLPCTELC